VQNPRRQTPDLAAADMVDAQHPLSSVDHHLAILDQPGIGEFQQRNVEGLGDLIRVGGQFERIRNGADTGHDVESRRRPGLVEKAHPQHLVGRNTQFLFRLAQRRRPGVLSGLPGATRKGDLTAMVWHVLRALGEHGPQLPRLNVERHQNGGLSRLSRRQSSRRWRLEARAQFSDPNGQGTSS